jgi:hypothetical protein
MQEPPGESGLTESGINQVGGYDENEAVVN